MRGEQCRSGTTARQALLWAGPVRAGAIWRAGQSAKTSFSSGGGGFSGQGWCCITLGGLPAFCERLPQVELRRAHHRFANRLRAGARSLRRAWDRRLVRDRWHARLAGHSQRFRQREAGRVRPPRAAAQDTERGGRGPVQQAQQGVCLDDGGEPAGQGGVGALTGELGQVVGDQGRGGAGEDAAALAPRLPGA